MKVIGQTIIAVFTKPWHMASWPVTMLQQIAVHDTEVLRNLIGWSNGTGHEALAAWNSLYVKCPIANKSLFRSSNKTLGLVLVSDCTFKSQWKKVNSSLSMGWISVGEAGVWGIKLNANTIYNLQQTFGDNRNITHIWEQVPVIVKHTISGPIIL